jgi:hypothetical protein
VDLNSGGEGARLRAYGHAGAWLFIASSLVILPSSLLMEPGPGPLGYAVVLSVLAAGLIALRVPWDRVGTVGLHVFIVFAAVEIALSAATFDWYANYYFLLLAVYAAGVLPRRRDVAAELILISVVLLAPVILAFDSGDAAIRTRLAVFTIPIAWLCAGLVMYLRERLDENLRGYDRLAGQTAELTERIRLAGGRLYERRRRG